MSDVYMPGLKSRFNSEKVIEDLMKVERSPKEKIEKNVENFESRKIWWQDLGRRVTTFRESARTLYSFQNPFNERVAISANENIITAAATREADEGEYQFTVKQLAQADRFLSRPITDEKMKIDAGNYTFSVGKDEISFNFRGGSPKEFIDVLNRQGRGKIGASLITVQPGTKSLLLESKVTGAENRLSFSGDAASLAVSLGIVEREEKIALNEDTVIEDIALETSAADDELFADGLSTDESEESLLESIAANDAVEDTPGMVAPPSNSASFTYKPIKAVSTAQDAIIEMEGIEMTRPSNVINDVIPGVTVTARGVSERPERLEVRPDREGVKDAIITLVGNYNRLMAELNVLLTPMPGADVLGSDAAARRTAASRIIDELTYLDKDEIEEMRRKLGAFATDSSLSQFRSSLKRTVTSPYPTDMERDLSMLTQIGIDANPRGGGYNQSQQSQRGYLQIDEKKLDAAIEQNLPAVKQLFASDTTGDLLADTGAAFYLDTLSKPFDGKELGGLISLKTGTIDSRISQDKRRIDTMERQLAAKEADLKVQFGRMESAYDRMEKMSSSLDSFSQRNNNNR